MQWCVGGLGPPAQSALRETLCTQPESLAVIDQQFYRGAALIAEDYQGAREGVELKLVLAKRDQRVDPLAKINRLAGKQNLKLRQQLDHLISSWIISSAVGSSV